MATMQKGNNTPSLTKKEIEILKWVQEGKTNEEIGLILGRTKWTVKFHLTNVMKKLDVASRTQAVSHAIAYGILPALRPIGTGEKGVGKLRIGLIGCGNGGSAMMELLKDNPVVELVWVADSNRKAPGLKIAKKLNVETSTDYVSMLKKKVDVVVNVTGSREISEELRQSVPTDVEIMGGVSAKIMVELFEERRKRMEERQKMLKEHEALYHLGLVIESIDSVNDAGYAIIDYATKLTNTPAGSLALFDEKNEDMVLVAAKGFSKQFKNIDRWEIRPGGLTSKILNQDGPMLIPDLTDHEEQNPVLLREGVKSILAAPLTVEGRIIGILYVNDFKPKNFRVEDISLFSLLTVYAGLTIDRVKSLEETRLLSITDGLTGLHNQRYMMEKLQGEVHRSKRHGSPLCVLMLDIDHFKKYNDTYGHLDGNKVLKTISRLIQKNSRGTDTTCRFGGEEFCIVMPEVEKEGAIAIAKRLIKSIESDKSHHRKVTMSGGVSSYPKDGKTHMELIKAADKRLYKAKAAGRNKIVCS